MKLVKTDYFQEDSYNIPTLNEKMVEPLDYANEVIAGFRECYTFLMTQRAKVKKILYGFPKLRTRAIFRNTSDYGKFLQASTNPKYLFSEKKRENLFSILYESKHIEQIIVDSEIKDLMNGDIPYFSMDPNGNVYNSLGTVIGNLGKTTSLFDNIATLNDERMKFTCELIGIVLKKPIKHWERKDGKSYYFDPVNGDMKTGWISNPGYDGTEWNYYDPVSGEKARGWRNIDGKWYYFIISALKGSQNLDGEKYYFDPVNCDMQTGWVSIQEASGTKRYYYDPESGKQLSGWQDIDGKRYYFGLYGAYSGRISGLDGKDYYFDSDTCELKIGWFESGKYKYYADPNDGGALASNKTLVIDGVSYSFYESGTLITDEP